MAVILTRGRPLLFAAFFGSGFAGLLYQVVWLRLAMAEFGVVTTVLSVVLSVFMLGLGIGARVGGNYASRRENRFAPLQVYAVVEAAIGLWALAVPFLFDFTASHALNTVDASSIEYSLRSALAIGVSILPGCILMGATFPLVAAHLRTADDGRGHSFSFLYLANVTGAVCGVALTAAFIIELVGFRSTLQLGAIVNFMVALIAVIVSVQSGGTRDAPAISHETTAVRQSRRPFLILGYTGFFSMAMEVAWTRAFTPIVQTTIYAFAFLLTLYLLATAIGSLVYRFHLRRNQPVTTDHLLYALAVTGFLPLLLTDPRLAPGYLNLTAGILPVCAVLGYLTPKLVDDYGRGEASAIGRAYAVNILGCVIGPLIAGYVLIPQMGVKWTLVAITLPIIALIRGGASSPVRLATLIGPIAVAVCATFVHTFEDGGGWPGRVEVRRDHVATVISVGEGMARQMLVNGIGITHLTPVTKVMAHLPMLMLNRAPQSVLIICFGMGTTFRSSLSWDVDTTAVELVPSVRDAFGFYFSDAAATLANPNGRVVIDDGRRFLRRTGRRFDVVTLDPPPPVEAAASSLLYSREFYESVKARLADDGVLQQWFPGGDRAVLVATVKALAATFPYVRAFHSREGWGVHLLASHQPLVLPSADDSRARMPAPAQADLMEWLPGETVEAVLAAMTGPEIAVAEITAAEAVGPLTDDRPYNEYFYLRRRGGQTLFLK